MDNIKQTREEEIDLRKLWESVITYKVLMSIITMTLTMIGLIYAFMKTPIYEVKATLEIGSTNKYSLIETPANLIKRLEIIQVINKNYKEQSILERVLAVRGSENLLEIAVIAPSNEEALKKLDFIIAGIQERHETIVNLYVQSVKDNIAKLEQQRESLVIEKRILSESITQKMQAQERLNKDNNSLVAGYMMNNNKVVLFSNLSNKIYEINNQIRELEQTISVQNIKPTAIVEQVIKSEDPIKPKKLEIVFIAFIGGLIVSIFCIFYLTLSSKKYV